MARMLEAHTPLHEGRREVVTKVVLSVLLVFLSTSFFFARWTSWKHYVKTSMITHDENRHVLMAMRVKANPRNYTIAGYDQVLLANMDPAIVLRDYTQEPEHFKIFQHPPLFIYAATTALILGGEKAAATAIVPALFGALLIPLMFLLGQRLFNTRAGLFAACLAFWDPFLRVCSQKVWMDIQLTFFVSLSVLFVVWALQTQRDRFWVWAGFSAGCALLTKYPAAVSLAGIILALGIGCPFVWRRRAVWGGLALAALMPAVWLGWVASVDPGFFSRLIARYKILDNSRFLIPVSWVVALTFWLVRMLKRHPLFLRLKTMVLRFRPVGMVIAVIGLVIVVTPAAQKAVNFSDWPETSWKTDFYRQFSEGKSVFYIQRTVEYSLLYALGWLGLFLPRPREWKPETLLLKFIVLFNWIFFTWVIAINLRYFLMAIPPLLLLSAGVLDLVWQKVRAAPHLWLRHLGTVLVVSFLILALAKTLLINDQIITPNRFCYF